MADEEVRVSGDRLNYLNSSCLYNRDKKIYPRVLDCPDFKYLTELLGYIKSDGSMVSSTLDGMKRVLKRMFGVNFEITLVDNCGQPEFFGCNVFPAKKALENISKDIITHGFNDLNALRNIWNTNDDWVMDLDSRMFYDTNINLNPAEIAAIMFFNIENIVFSLRPLERTNAMVRAVFSKSSILVNNLARSSVGIHTFVLPLVQACLFKSYPYEKEDSIVAGSCFSINLDMKIYLKNAVQKVLVSVSNDDIDKPINAMDNDVLNVAQWILAAISDMRYSTTRITDTIEKVLLITKSPYLKTVYAGILMSIGDYSRGQTIEMESAIPELQRKFALNPKAVEFRREQYKKNARDRISKMVNQAVMEGFLDLLDNLGNMPKVSQKEIDMIRVQVQKIETVDDKMYVLDELHSKLDIVEMSLTLLESNDEKQRKKVKVSKSTLMDQKKQLDTIRDLIIRREIKEPEYSLHIDYPKGYEA